MKVLGFLCAFVYLLPSAAFAGHRHYRHYHHYVQRHHYHRHYVQHRRQHVAEAYDPSADLNQLVDNPSGCPRTSFCGCGAAVRAFGQPVRDLWLAANWFKFPRAEPAPGMVAVRQHHVFFIEAVLGRGLVIAYDANSGGHKTRIHTRSTRGYTIVNPRGGNG